MHTIRSRLLWPFLPIGIVLGALAVVVGMLIAIRGLPGSNAEAQATPPGRNIRRYAEQQDVDADLERFAGEIAGIRIAPRPDLLGRLDECPSGFEQDPAGAPTAGALTPFPSVLPPPARLTESVGVRCGKEFVSTEASYSVPGDLDAGRLGGILHVHRFRGQRVVPLHAPLVRLSASEIEGRPAAVLRPIMQDGYGQAAVVVNEPWGVTFVRATGMTLDELLEVAASLYEGERR